MQTFFVRPFRVSLALGLALGLAACAEREVILPGEREDIRQVNLLPEQAPEALEGSRAISLPPVQNSATATQSPGTPQFRVTNAALSAAPQLLWSTSIGAGDSRKNRITAAPVVGAGRIYTLDSNAQVTAVSPSGGVIWSVDAKPVRDREGDATGGGLAYADGALYVSLGFGELAKLDAATGATIWTQQLNATGSGSPAIVGNLVYLVAGDDTGWAVEADSGRIAWQIAATPSVSNILGAPAPVVSDDLTIFAFGSGELIATFRRGGLRRWSASVAGQRLGRAASRIGDITGAPMLDGSTLYAGNHSGRLAAFDVASGERLWTAREGAFNPVWPAGDSIFAVTDRNQLIRVDKSTGTTIWEVDLPGFVRDRPRRRGEIFAHHGPIIAGSRLIVASNDGVLRSFSPVNGALVGTTEIPGGATTAPVVAGGVLYVVSTRGQLHAFR